MASSISFCDRLIPPVLDGRKTQTRRICKGQRELSSAADFQIDRCPYGKPGDLLYLRETYYQRGSWQPVAGVCTPTGDQKWQFVPANDEVLFDAPAAFRVSRDRRDPGAVCWHKRIARFMFRRYSRCTLRITDVRVERLHDISEADAMAEGVDKPANEPAVAGGLMRSFGSDSAIKFEPYASAFAQLWESINGPGSFDGNHWVWVITFGVIPRNIDAVLCELAHPTKQAHAVQ